MKRGLGINIKLGKKSQVTVFVILSLILIASLIFVLIFLRKPIKELISPSENPESYIQDCSKKVLENVEKKILEGNGYLNKTDNYVVYQGKNVPYLCKSSQFYMPCVNQEPAFLGLVKKEIDSVAKEDFKACFSKLVDSLRNKEYEVIESGNFSYEIIFQQGFIKVVFAKTLSIKRGEDAEEYKSFSGIINSPLYDLVDFAETIVNSESQFCEFDEMGAMLDIKEVDIEKFVTGDSSKIYAITDRKTGKALSFAVKTCVLPAGF